MVKEFNLGEKSKKFPMINGRDDFDRFFEFEDVKKAIQILKDKIYSGEWANNMDYVEMRGNIIDEINKVFGEELK